MIRCLLLSLLLACAGEWVRSHRYESFAYGAWRIVMVGAESVGGTFYIGLAHFREPQKSPDAEWYTHKRETDGGAFTFETEGHHALGFACGTLHEDGVDMWFAGVPYWGLTIVGTGLLAFVWRKSTKTKSVRGFPVEMKARDANWDNKLRL